MRTRDLACFGGAGGLNGGRRAGVRAADGADDAVIPMRGADIPPEPAKRHSERSVCRANDLCGLPGADVPPEAPS